ncbi:MAG: glycosyltransferase family 1 protein [Desulfobacterales bacterium]|nr:glycosyltransferase family 1 protein [Desulfobacterales bacterium]
MKIIALLEIKITSGGGFNQAMNAIFQMKRLCENRFEFAVITTIQDNIPILERLDINADLMPVSLFGKLLLKFVTMPLWQRIQSRLRLILPFEKMLINHGADLIYFVAPSARSTTMQRLNYITTVWDMCHRDTPEFPEIREFNQFHALENLYRSSLAPSVTVLTDSITSAENISRRYGIDRDRLLPMPFSPATFLSEMHANGMNEVLDKYRVEYGYFFYPSQFWSHKNHIRILEALLILRQEGIRPIVVFTGSDTGNRKVVEGFITQNDLAGQVKILGFVPAEDMRGLYSGCRAVVMPTYFGPTNLPPLEAWMIGKPLIYSLHFHEQAGDAAILIDPDNSVDLAKAMKAIMDDRLCIELVEKGRRRLQEIENQRDAAEMELLARLVRFEKRSRCWRAKPSL